MLPRDYAPLVDVYFPGDKDSRNFKTVAVLQLQRSRNPAANSYSVIIS